MKRQLLVGAAIIKKGRKFLITQRLPYAHNANRWEFPGGKVDFGEDPRAALEREIKEELDITITAGDILDYSSHVYGKEKHVVLLGILCTYKKGKIKKKEVQDFAWVTLKEMKQYDITEADVPFIEKLKKNLNISQEEL